MPNKKNCAYLRIEMLFISIKRICDNKIGNIRPRTQKQPGDEHGTRERKEQRNYEVKRIKRKWKRKNDIYNDLMNNWTIENKLEKKPQCYLSILFGCVLVHITKDSRVLCIHHQSIVIYEPSETIIGLSIGLVHFFYAINFSHCVNITTIKFDWDILAKKGEQLRSLCSENNSAISVFYVFVCVVFC